MANNKHEELLKKVEQLRCELRDEKAQLTRLAAECIQMGREMAQDEGVLRQSRLVDDMVVEEHKLRKMLKKYDAQDKKKK